MDKIKSFVVNHFEKLAVVAAVLITAIFLIGVFRRGRVDELGEDIQRLIDTIKGNMKKAGVEQDYDSRQVPDYAEQALGPFRDKKKAILLTGVRWYPRVIIELKPIKLELPPGVPFGKTFEAYPEIEAEAPPETTVVRIANEDFGTVDIVDDQHFALRRDADLPAEDGSTLIHIYYADGRQAVRRLEVTIRVVYIPKPPPAETMAGYPKPGRNFIIWSTHKDDLENVVGFNIYRKESEEAEFDLEDPLNREEFIEPLSYVPRVGEDEDGEVPEGEEQAPREEEEKPGPAEEPEEEEAPGRAERLGEEEEGRPFVLPGLEEEGAKKRTRNIFDRKVGGKFVDRDVTPLQTYWYAVQTVAKKPEEERGKEASDGEQADLYVRSILSEPVMIKGGDVIKIVFRSVMGDVEDPESKKEARAGIEIRRFVKTDWVVGRFNVKIGEKVGGEAWVKDYPEIDPDTDEVSYNGKLVNFVTKYTLEDIVLIIEEESYKVKTYRPDPKTGRMIEHEETRHREAKSYKIILRHEDGSSREYMLERPKREKPKTRTDKKKKKSPVAPRRPPTAPTRPPGGGPPVGPRPPD